MRRTLLALLASLPLACPAGAADDESDIISVIDRFFAAMTARDVEAMRELMTVDGMLYGYRETDDGVQIINLTHQAYLEGLGQRDSVPLERYWDPVIMVHDRLATVWTPYDFHADGRFSHCGVNNFSLLRTADGWVIAGVVFSIEPDNCPASPPGPLE